MDDFSGGGAIVLPFVPRHTHPLSLSVSERIEAMHWADAASGLGVRKLRIYEPEFGRDGEIGGFVLIYETDNIWASWGVAVLSGSFEVWRPSNGMTVGWYRRLREALHAIKDVA